MTHPIAPTDATAVPTDLPLVSIVTPSFNQAGFLEATIRSVLDQGYPNLEYIVIDGGSTDGSVDIIKKHADRIAYWVSESDRGQTDAINKGFAQAHGDVLAWLNSDDVYLPGAVSAGAAFLQSHPDVGMVYGGAVYLDEHGNRTGQFPSAQTSYSRLRRGFVHIPQQAAFFRARLWRMLGPLDPSFLFAMDYDLWVRIASVSRLAFVPGAWAGFRIHEAGKTVMAADRCWPEMMRVHRQIGGRALSVLGAKYLVRRWLEPVMPWRLKLRLALGRLGH